MPEGPVTIAECVHCTCLTLNPASDRCACGEELYPVVKIVPAGTRVRASVELLVVEEKKDPA